MKRKIIRTQGEQGGTEKKASGNFLLFPSSLAVSKLITSTRARVVSVCFPSFVFVFPPPPPRQKIYYLLISTHANSSILDPFVGNYEGSRRSKNPFGNCVWCTAQPFKPFLKIQYCIFSFFFEPMIPKNAISHKIIYGFINSMLIVF